jgi:hypothetical protein
MMRKIKKVTTSQDHGLAGGLKKNIHTSERLWGEGPILFNPWSAPATPAQTDFLQAPLDKSSCASFVDERRMKSVEPIEPNSKLGPRAPVQGEKKAQNPQLQAREGHRRSLDNSYSRSE